MGFVNMADVDLGNGFKGSQFYRGQIINNNDPMKIGRVRLRVADFQAGIADEDLPWAMPMVKKGGGTSKQGEIDIPMIGSYVMCAFADGDPHSPIFFGAATAESLGLEEFTSDEDYPNIYAKIDQSGNLIYINYAKGTFKFIHNSGAFIDMDGKGHVKIGTSTDGEGEETHPEGLTIEVDGDAIINAKKKAEVWAQEDVTIGSEGGSIVFVGSGFTMYGTMSVNPSSGTPPTAPSFTPPTHRTKPPQQQPDTSSEKTDGGPVPQTFTSE